MLIQQGPPMRASDIAKLAASIDAGYVTYDTAIGLLRSDADISLLDSFLASLAGAADAGAADAGGADADIIGDFL